jgi:hypothetical protein
MSKLNKQIESLVAYLDTLDMGGKIDALNEIRERLHDAGPFKNEPVDLVKWVRNDTVVANDYNPNKVAPPEMQLLEVSIINDGYTQPIVTFPQDDKIEVVDGFHRSRVGKESIIVSGRVNGYLPIVSIRKDKQGKQERIASTIRHNRARGKHQVSAMSEIVMELKNRNWTNKRISHELGMDEDEILRLCQISGIENLFQDKDFSKAWVSNDEPIDEFEAIDDDVSDSMDLVKIPNETDETRIFHTFEKWEAVEYGFYDTAHKTMTKLQCEHKYKILLSDQRAFSEAIEGVFKDWKHSCEHNLTNKSLNRIAWLGQAAVSYVYRVPSIYSSGWNLLTKDEQNAANATAHRYLNIWLKDNGLDEITLEQALQIDRQVELY